MSDGAKWIPSVARVGRIGTLLLLAAIVVRTSAVALVSLNREIAALAAQDRVLIAGGGDVSLRDAPKAHELRRGRFFSDPYYAGERHWYPFLTSLAAAAVSGATGGAVPEAFFRAEIGFVALALVGAGALVFFACGWPGLVWLPLVVWLGALAPGNGLYPVESVRGAFCLFLALAGYVWQQGAPLSPRRAAGLGLAVGLLGLWNGAAFAVAGVVAGVVVMGRVGEPWRRPAQLWRLLPFVAGVAVPLALLFAPQALRHGHFTVPGAARVWAAEIYQGGTLARALTFPLAPRGIHLALLVALLARLAAGRRLGLAPWPRVVPLLVAYGVSLLLAHLGYLTVDRDHPVLARVARSLLLAPAHTFVQMAEACRPIIAAAGLVAIVQVARAALRGRLADRPWFAAVAPVLALAASAALLFTFPYRITRYATSEARPFMRFAQQVGDLTDGERVFFRYPGRFVQGTSVKILKLSVAEYANPYVHRDRVRAEQALDEALGAGDVATADAVLERHQIGFIMEDPRAPDDPVIRRCGGDVVAQHAGYRLRWRSACRR